MYIFTCCSFTVMPEEGKRKLPRTSVWNCDGEILDAPDIHVKVHRRVLRVFGRGPETETSKRSSFSDN